MELPSAIQDTAMSTLQGTTLENRLPLEVYVSGVKTLRIIRTEGARGSPHKLPS